MSISEISESDACCEEYGEFIDEKESAVAELNGCKRELTVLHRSKSNRYFDVFQETRLHGHSLKTRSITHKPFASSIIRPMKAGGSVEFEVSVRWGGEAGTSWTGGVSAEAYDDKGNYAKVEVKKDSEGNASAGVSGGHKEESE